MLFMLSIRVLLVRYDWAIVLRLFSLLTLRLNAGLCSVFKFMKLILSLLFTLSELQESLLKELYFPINYPLLLTLLLLVSIYSNIMNFLTLSKNNAITCWYCTNCFSSNSLFMFIFWYPYYICLYPSTYNLHFSNYTFSLTICYTNYESITIYEDSEMFIFLF